MEKVITAIANEILEIQRLHLIKAATQKDYKNLAVLTKTLEDIKFYNPEYFK